METHVIVVGAGPVGLMLAGELRLAGAEVCVCERLPAASGESRGVGFTRRAAEVFDQRGVLDRLGEIEIGRETHFGGVRIDSALLDDNHYGVRGVPQDRVEAVLEEWALSLGAQILRGHEVVGVTQWPDRVEAQLDGPDGPLTVSGRYLVGCDGARSMVRRAAGIDFPGRAATRGAYVADIAGAEIRPRAIGELVPGGMVMAVRLGGGVDRIVIHPDDLPPRDLEDLTFAEIADSWQKLTGQSLHDAQPRWISCFTDTSRQASRYRSGRVFLAGDAAHIHIPAGAQGLSAGVQDAVNLGWKLGAVVTGRAPEALLDTYESERHPVGRELLRNTRAQASIYLGGDAVDPVRVVLRELVQHPEAARLMAAKVSGVGIRYATGLDGHPLLGQRLSPDWSLMAADGAAVRVAEMLRAAEWVLIDAGGVGDAGFDAALAGMGPVRTFSGHWDGADPRQAGVSAVLLRPDGHIAWAAPGAGEPHDVLDRWLGAVSQGTQGAAVGAGRSA